MSTAAAPVTPLKWKPYPVCQPAGEDWLGHIPVHWNVSRLKYLSRRSALYGANESADSYVDEGVRFLRTTDIDDNGRLKDTGAVYLERPLVLDYLLNDGDLLLSRSGTLGRAFVYNKKQHGECAYAGYLVRFVLADAIDARLVFYFTKSLQFTEWLNLSVIQSTIGNVNGQKYANMPLPVPPRAEQRDIVTFLNRETAKIDALIAKKERMIALLQEKRAAIVYQAVTGGLDGDAAAEALLLPWRDRLPSRWGAQRLKSMVSYVTSGSRGWAKYYSDEGDVFLRISNLSRTSIKLNLTDDIQHVAPPPSAEGERTRVRGGDVLVSITAYIGSVAVAPDDIDKAFVNQHIALVRPCRQIVIPKWLGYCLFSMAGQQQLTLSLYGGTKDGLGLNDVKNVVLPLPPIAEQEAIIRYLDGKMRFVDTLIEKVCEHIERLREHRTVLISAVVTGKIDVRKDASRW